MIYSDNTFDITNNIVTYTRRDFKSVFDTASNKWYMLNNLDNYEEYGIYGDNFDTYYQGKLVVVNDREYEWNGTQWVDLGEYIEQVVAVYRDAQHTGIIKFNENTYRVTSIEATFKMMGATSGDSFLIGSGPNDSNDWRVFLTGTSGNSFYYDCGNGRYNGSMSGIYNTIRHMRFDGAPMRIYDYDNERYLYTGSYTRPTTATDIITFGGYNNRTSGTPNYGYLYDLVFYSDNNGQNAIAHYVPKIQNDTVGMYDTINDVFVPATGTLGAESGSVRPKDYPEKAAPTISTLWASTIYRNSSHLTTLMRNDGEMVKIDYMGDDILKKGEAPIPIGPNEERPFGMKVYDGDINVQRRANYYSDCVIYYLIDSYSDNNWSVFPVDSVGVNVNSGSTIYFYGPSTNRISRENSEGKFFISGTGKVDLIGNFLSLCNPNWTENMKITTTLNNQTGLFCSLFSALTNIYNAKDMYIRTDEITCGNNGNYGIAFGYMFDGCTNLLAGPTWICKDNKLSIDKYAQFIGMFGGCTNLKTVTLPPITTYSSNRHFETMLEKCSSLETIYYDGVYPINSTSNSRNFSSGMNTTGDFYNLKNANVSRDVNGIPSGWTIHTSL